MLPHLLLPTGGSRMVGPAKETLETKLRRIIDELIRERGGE